MNFKESTFQSTFVYLMVLLLALNKELNCKGYKPSFTDELVRTEGKQPRVKPHPQNYHNGSAKESLNNKITSSSYPYPNFFLKWIAFSRKRSKYNYSKIIQTLQSTNKGKNDIKLLHARRIKRACKLTMNGRRRRGFGEECIGGGKDISSGGGGGSGSGGTSSEGVLSTTDPSQVPSTSKYLTTITSSSTSEPVTSSTDLTSNDNIPLIPNEPIQTESNANDFVTTRNTEQATTLSARYSGSSTYLTTTSLTSAPPSATPRTTRSVRVTLSQMITTAMSMQKQTSTHTVTHISNTQNIYLKSSVTSILSNISDNFTNQFKTSKEKDTTSSATNLFTKQETSYANRTHVLSESTSTSEKTRISSVHSSIPTSADVKVTTISKSEIMSTQSVPVTTVLPASTSIIYSKTMSKAAFTTDVVSKQPNSESVLSSDVVSTNTVINVSYPVHKTVSILSKVSDTAVHSRFVSSAPSSTKAEKLSTTVTPVETSVPQAATASLQTPLVVSDKILTVSDLNTFSAATAHESNSLPRKTSMGVTKSRMLSNVGTSDYETVTISTDFPTIGGKVNTVNEITAITVASVSIQIQTQATPTAFNTSESDYTESGFFETASNVAIVSTVAVTTALVSAVLLIYSYMSQTGGAGQLCNSVSNGDESRWNGYDRVSSTRQDRASPSSTTNLISGSSPPLTPVEVYDVTGLDF